MKGFQSQFAIPIEDNESPVFRNLNKPNNSVLFAVSGGLGDRILMHPIITYFRRHYRHKITVVSNVSFLYDNIPDITNLTPNDEYDYTQYHVYTPFMPRNYLMYQLINSNNINHLDYLTINTIQSTLPNPEDKLIQIPLCDTHLSQEILSKIQPILDNYLLFHFSNSEPLRHIPSDYVENLLSGLAANLKIPIVIVGKTQNDLGNGSLHFRAPFRPNVIDLRDQTTVAEAVFLAQKARIVITSDSYPLHTASSINSNAHIFYFSYFKHNGYLAHYRRTNEGQVQFAWRTENLIIKPDVDFFLDPEFRFYGNQEDIERKVAEMRKQLPPIIDVIDKVKLIL